MNSGPRSLTRSERWILSECQVLRHRQEFFDERLIMHRARTPFAEIDLLMESRERRLTLLEVKSVGIEVWGERSLITQAQTHRLTRARAWLEMRFERPVVFLLAVVSHENVLFPSIQYFEAGADWLLT